MVDPEVNAIDASVTALEPLDEHVRRRVLRYLLDRYAYAPPAPAAEPYRDPALKCLTSFELCGGSMATCTQPYGHRGPHAWSRRG